jgi:putative flavoprotein involved in K+ transport
VASGETYDAIVIGAGQAGLAAGYHLRRAGLRFVLLEGADEPGGSWRRYYDSLTLFSPAAYSSLPGRPFPGDPDHYPRRDEVVAYLQDYARAFELPVVTGARVTAVERGAEGFRVATEGQGEFHGRSVIAATGSFGNPYVPEIPGRSGYLGQVLHAFAYRNPEPFAGQRVVVVGGANSAVQIGVELARIARVTLATRGVIIFVPQRILGQDGHFWLRVTGLDNSRFLKDQSTPVVDAGNYRAAVAAGRPDRRRMFERVSERGVGWKDLGPEEIDAVIFATGYRPSLGYLAGLGALDEAGRPLQDDGVSTVIPGLYYVGFSGQRNFASATLRGVGPDSEIVVSQLLRQGRAGSRAS